MRIPTKDPGTMTNSQIVKEHNRCLDRELVIARQMVKDGFGHVRPSDMRENPDIHEDARETLALLDRRAALKSEAKYRYGPDLRFVDDLLRSGKKGYRRVEA